MKVTTWLYDLTFGKILQYMFLSLNLIQHSLSPPSTIVLPSARITFAPPPSTKDQVLSHLQYSLAYKLYQDFDGSGEQNF